MANTQGITPDMKKIMLAALLLTFASNAFAAPRVCRNWRRDRHHHRYCARWR
jgi:hypothetical protein